MSSRIDNKSRLFIGKWESVGDKIIKTLKYLFVIALFSQFLSLFTIDGLPPNSTLKMEGKAIIENLFEYTEGEIVLKFEKFNDKDFPKIMINGIERIVVDKELITLKVNDADIIEVDGTSCLDIINISIFSVSDSINIPKANLSYYINKNLVYLFRVKMKSKE